MEGVDDVLHENLQEVQEAACLFCPEIVRYVVDFSRDVNSPKPLTKSVAGIDDRKFA